VNGTYFPGGCSAARYESCARIGYNGTAYCRDDSGNYGYCESLESIVITPRVARESTTSYGPIKKKVCEAMKLVEESALHIDNETAFLEVGEGVGNINSQNEIVAWNDDYLCYGSASELTTISGFIDDVVYRVYLVEAETGIEVMEGGRRMLGNETETAENIVVEVQVSLRSER